MSNFFTPDLNNESAIAPWNTSLEPTPGIIPKLDAKGILTGGVGQEVNIPTLTPNTYDNIILPDASPTLMAKALTTDSNSSLPDSSVDLLTGQAMSEVYEDLSKFAAEPDFVTEMNVAFGENWDAAGGKALAEGWFNRDFSAIPPVKVVSSAEIGGANGAFAAATDTIYLSKEFLAQNGANPGAVADVLLEEIGHSVDARLNVTDSPGDEGAIFSAVVQGKDLSQDELQGLKGEDDTATVLLDGHQYLVEKQLNPAGSIGSYYNRNPAIAQALGQPTGAEFQFSPGKWRQNFQGGAIFHSAQGSYSVRGSLGRHYLNLGGQDSQLGLPTREEFQVPNGWRQNFQGGAIFHSGAGSYMTRGSLGNYYLNNLGGEKSQLGLPTSNELHMGGGNWRQSFEKGTLEWLSNGTPRVTLTQNQVPANNWKAEYFNNTNLTGTPVFVENLGDGSRFSRNWGTGAPTNTPSDNFSAKITTQRYLAPGLYKIETQADDGIRVRIKNQTVIDQWNYKSFAANSGYFRSIGETVPIAVDYSELGGGAALNFNIIPVTTKFQDTVNPSQQWKATVYSWNSSQGSAPPTNFWAGDINNPNAIGVINLGSNNRSDGKKGINANWGTGAPNGDNNRLPHDFFAMRAYTQANFDGSSYKFRVQGDDGFQLLARNQSTGQWFNITSANQWTQSYSAQEINYQLPAGQYDMHFHQYEGGGDARFDLSWEKMGNSANGGGASLVKFAGLSGNDRNLPGTVFPPSYGNPFANISNTTPERWLGGQGQEGQQARYIQDPEMPVVANTQSRSADQLRQVIDYFNVEDPQNLRYKPNGLNTFCNIFATDVMRALRAPLPHWTNTGRELDANGTNDWLNNSANGWKKVTAQDATNAASQGIPTVASWKNVVGIGHIAVVRPEAGPTPDNPQIAQAGARNFVKTTVNVGFGQTNNVSYFAYYA